MSTQKQKPIANRTRKSAKHSRERDGGATRQNRSEFLHKIQEQKLRDWPEKSKIFIKKRTQPSELKRNETTRNNQQAVNGLN